MTTLCHNQWIMNQAREAGAVVKRRRRASLAWEDARHGGRGHALSLVTVRHIWGVYGA